MDLSFFHFTERGLNTESIFRDVYNLHDIWAGYNRICRMNFSQWQGIVNIHRGFDFQLYFIIIIISNK